MYICIDFDGTIVEHAYPHVGAPVPHALRVMRRLAAEGHRLILLTMRSGPTLDDAVKYLTDRGIPLFGVNDNPTQSSWTESRKVYGQIYIDDAALGCPLVYPTLTGAAHPGAEPFTMRPFVGWEQVEALLDLRGAFAKEGSE